MPSPLQSDATSALPPQAGLVRVDPIVAKEMLISSHGSWGLAGSLTLHAAAVLAFGGWISGWLPGWNPPPAGISSQSQAGERYTSVSAAPASDPLEKLGNPPPVEIEIVKDRAPRDLLAASHAPSHSRVSAGRPIDVVLHETAQAPPRGHEASLRHEVAAVAKGDASFAATSPTKSAVEVPQRSLATGRPKTSAQAVSLDSTGAIGSKGQAGAQTNAAPRALFSPEPPYPPQALAAGVSGKVVVRIRVDAKGQVITARLHASSGNTFLDDAAIATVRRWRFEPRTEAGSDPVEIAVPIRFEIEKQP